MQLLCLSWWIGPAIPLRLLSVFINVVLDFHETCRFGHAEYLEYLRPRTTSTEIEPSYCEFIYIFVFFFDCHYIVICFCPVSKLVILQHAVQNVLFTSFTFQFEAPFAMRISPSGGKLAGNFSQMKMCRWGRWVVWKVRGVRGASREKGLFRMSFNNLCQKYVLHLLRASLWMMSLAYLWIYWYISVFRNLFTFGISKLWRMAGAHWGEYFT